MSDIVLGHEESNIRCTIVLLKALVDAGVAPVPLPVELSLGSDEGWRRAAITHLDMGRQAPKRKRAATDWEEVNEELDFYDRRAR